MDKISEEKIKKILSIKEGLMVTGINEKDIAILPKKIHPIVYGKKQVVIFSEVADIPVIEIPENN